MYTTLENEPYSEKLNFPVKRPWFRRSKGLRNLRMPSMLPRTMSLKVQRFWLLCCFSSCCTCMEARLSRLTT
ncbi:hypothetical protein CRUP_017439 [Coryphaenoides rupestris]|nr:hypothetical protein CRUP_017439 [Coryphaenoides rupestris]